MDMMKKIRLIGDVHGNFDFYEQITKDCESSLQVGDMGYKYDRLVYFVDDENHKFIPGNHENYDEVFDLPHVLTSKPVEGFEENPHFGPAELNGFEFFFVRGGFSIDHKIRDYRYKIGQWSQTYFPQEEISLFQRRQCFALYTKLKPKILIAHECPRSIARMVGSDQILKDFGHDPETFTTSTSELLEAMIQAHPPEKMYFGHYHRDWSKQIGNTLFTCIADEQYIDLEY